MSPDHWLLGSSEVLLEIERWIADMQRQSVESSFLKRPDPREDPKGAGDPACATPTTAGQYRGNANRLRS